MVPDFYDPFYFPLFWEKKKKKRKLNSITRCFLYIALEQLWCPHVGKIYFNTCQLGRKSVVENFKSCRHTHTQGTRFWYSKEILFSFQIVQKYALSTQNHSKNIKFKESFRIFKKNADNKHIKSAPLIWKHLFSVNYICQALDILICILVTYLDINFQYWNFH